MKFIELTHKDVGKFLVAVHKIVAVIPQGDYTYVEFNCDDKLHRRSWGYLVLEGYEKIKCMLNGVFESQ